MRVAFSSCCMSFPWKAPVHCSDLFVFPFFFHTHHSHIILMSAKVQPPVGYKPIEGNCPLPEKVVNKKSNEIWLIRAPKDVWSTETM